MEAPMSSSLGAMGPLLRKLDLLLAPECRLPSSLKHAIELLKEDLEEISAALVEQSMIDSPSNKAKYWMDEVRDLSYDMEDCIDNMMQKHSSVKSRSIHHFKVARLKIGRFPKMLKPSTRITKIAEIRTLLREASERYQRYQLDCGAMNPRFAITGAHSPVSALCKTSTDLVGVEDSRKELTKWLTNQEEEQLKVLSIVGPAGVGKTTLARALYRELKCRFECQAFIRVSRNPEMSKLIGDILSQVHWPKETPDASALQNSINSIKEHLQDKRYLIVIDDLWDATPWDILNNAFPKGNNCSRIIITSEFQDVAECSSYHSVKFFVMKPLLSQDSEKIFIHRVLGSDHHFAYQLKGLPCRIINACGGLPLAVIMMTGLLASKPDLADLWDQLQQYFPPSLEEKLEKILKLCYNSLPQYLKTCLLYLDIYPEGSTVWKVDLLKQWTAEGFISPTEVIEGVAESYFDELVSRGMIQPEKVNNNDEVLSCTVHHTVHDLIRRKSSEEKFITAIDYSQTITGFPMKVHRLSLHFSSGTYASKPKGIGLSKVRSLAFFGLHRCMPSIMELKHLRVLNLELWGDYEDCTTLNLSGICRLFQLRYLKVKSHMFVELPSEIRGLQFLETLEIDAKVSHIPTDIACLASLLHLSLRDGTKVPDGIGCITSLQTLRLSSPIFTFTIFPKWIAKLQKLQTLKIIVRVLLQNDIDILAGLPVLTSLSLFVCRPTSESVVFQNGAFPVLKNFKYRCGALCLIIKDKALPNLERLKLGFNVHKGDKYANMIFGIEYLFNLKEIAVEIGAAAGADESDRKSAEFKFKDAIQKHSRFHGFINIKRVDWIEEEQMLCLPIPSPGVGCNLVAPPPDGQEAWCSQGEEDEPDPDGAAQDKDWDAAVKLIERWEGLGAADKLVFDSWDDGKEHLSWVWRKCITRSQSFPGSYRKWLPRSRSWEGGSTP